MLINVSIMWNVNEESVDIDLRILPKKQNSNNHLRRR